MLNEPVDGDELDVNWSPSYITSAGEGELSGERHSVDGGRGAVDRREGGTGARLGQEYSSSTSMIWRVMRRMSSGLTLACLRLFFTGLLDREAVEDTERRGSSSSESSAMACSLRTRIRGWRLRNMSREKTSTYY
jgi:hypothetical protein